MRIFCLVAKNNKTLMITPDGAMKSVFIVTEVSNFSFLTCMSLIYQMTSIMTILCHQLKVETLAPFDSNLYKDVRDIYDYFSRRLLVHKTRNIFIRHEREVGCLHKHQNEHM